MPQNTNSPSSRNNETASVYSRLVRDPRISHGAFRLWHLLRDYRNTLSGLAWPSQATIARQMHCKVHSLKEWTAQLVSGGYFTVDQTGQNHHLVYRFNVATPKRTDAPNSSRPAPSGSLALPKPAMRGHAQRGILTELREPNPITECRTDAPKLGIELIKNLTNQVTTKVSVCATGAPSVGEVVQHITTRCRFNGADQFARKFHQSMSAQSWRHKQTGHPVTEWRRLAENYVNKCGLNQRLNRRF